MTLITHPTASVVPVDEESRQPPCMSVSNLQGRFPKTIADYDSAINRVAQRLGNRGVSALERLATAVYVTRRHADLSLTERAAQLCKLKPHISKDDALGAVREADEVLDEVAGSAA